MKRGGSSFSKYCTCLPLQEEKEAECYGPALVLLTRQCLHCGGNIRLGVGPPFAESSQATGAGPKAAHSDVSPMWPAGQEPFN